MKFLSRQEEMVLLSIMKLRENAYGVPIREHVSLTTGKTWSLGAVYDILDRLTRKGLVKTTTSAPVKARGGKSKRYYAVTRHGHEALEEARLLQERIWSGLVEPAWIKE